MAVHVELHLLFTNNNVLAFLYVSMHTKCGWAKGNKPYKMKIITFLYPLYKQMCFDLSVSFFKSGEVCDWKNNQRCKLYITFIDIQI